MSFCINLKYFYTILMAPVLLEDCEYSSRFLSVTCAVFVCIHTLFQVAISRPQAINYDKQANIISSSVQRQGERVIHDELQHNLQHTAQHCMSTHSNQLSRVCFFLTYQSPFDSISGHYVCQANLRRLGFPKPRLFMPGSTRWAVLSTKVLF